MNVRDELFEAMTDGGRNLAPGEADSVDALIDAFAAELVANLRAATAAGYPDVLAHTSTSYAMGWRHGRETAAKKVEEG